MLQLTPMEYRYTTSERCCIADYVWPTLLRLLDKFRPPPARVLDLGCGNGATARFLHQRGYSVTGIDISVSGVAIARESCTKCRFEVASVYDNNLVERFGRFDIVVSLEVIEHCADSYGFMSSVQSLLDHDGVAILSTPYHAFLKNLLIVASGRFEAHFDPLWAAGHLKFFTIPKLRQLIENVGLEPITFVRTGRIPPVAKSVVAALKHRGPRPSAVPETLRKQA